MRNDFLASVVLPRDRRNGVCIVVRWGSSGNSAVKTERLEVVPSVLRIDDPSLRRGV